MNGYRQNEDNYRRNNLVTEPKLYARKSNWPNYNCETKLRRILLAGTKPVSPKRQGNLALLTNRLVLSGKEIYHCKQTAIQRLEEVLRKRGKNM